MAYACKLPHFFLLYVLLVFVIHSHSCSLPAILPLTQMRDVYGGSIPINIMNEPGELLAAGLHAGGIGNGSPWRFFSRIDRRRIVASSARANDHYKRYSACNYVTGKPPHQVTIIISRHSHEASKAGCAGDGGWL